MLTHFKRKMLLLSNHCKHLSLTVLTLPQRKGLINGAKCHAFCEKWWIGRNYVNKMYSWLGRGIPKYACFNPFNLWVHPDVFSRKKKFFWGTFLENLSSSYVIKELENYVRMKALWSSWTFSDNTQKKIVYHFNLVKVRSTTPGEGWGATFNPESKHHNFSMFQYLKTLILFIKQC